MNVKLLRKERGVLKVNRSDVASSHTRFDRLQGFCIGISKARAHTHRLPRWLLASERDDRDREIASPSEISLELRARKRTAIFIKYFGGVRHDWKNSRNRTSYKNTENSTAAAMARR